MTTAFQSLKSITWALLAPVLENNVMREASLSLKRLFEDLVVFDEMDPANQQDIPTESGKAIAPRWAAACLGDMMRTRKFIMGIKDAIEEKLKMNPDKPVTILYAGTGPFASLLTPLITVFKPDQLQMILIEIHPGSIRYLEKTIQQFGMKDYLIELVKADATTYSIPDYQQPDIVVSETMNNALQKEPYVSIVANLMWQCKKNPVLIPELITVDVCLMGNLIDNPEDMIHLKTLLELNAETAVQIKKNPKDIPVLSTGIIVTIPSLPSNQYKQIVLCTSIRIFRQHNLGFNESGLTVPHILRMTDSIKKYPISLFFQYHIESNPGFRVIDS